MRHRIKRGTKFGKGLLMGTGMLMVVVCWQNLGASNNAPLLSEIREKIQNSLYLEGIKNHMPALDRNSVYSAKKKDTGQETIWQKIWAWHSNLQIPVLTYAQMQTEYETQVESELTYEMLLAREGVDEYYRDGAYVGDVTEEEQIAMASLSDQLPETITEESISQEIPEETIEPEIHISREKLNDFDYLIQNFYTVDKTTTIDGTLLNAESLLNRDMRLTTPKDQPQILIHHTHSQERFLDSTGDPSTSIVGVGDYLTRILQEKYGFCVIHDTGEYDVIDHDNAYSYAGPAVEQILKENPSIEVVIDMHRDGVDNVHFATEVNGKPTAKIMFFNGLSRTTTKGNLEYLYNPYLEDNLAFSLQLKVLAEEYYPGFTRPNYLKGYRYNLHYVPKSLLVEIGTQNNTVEEAMNAMEPLADLLSRVLAP